MLKARIFWFVIIPAFVQGIGSSPAQSLPVSGLYQIISGNYGVCCGITGNPIVVSLPNQSQSFVRLTVDPQSSTATMTFLADDRRTVFSTVPCPPSGAIDFNFDFGFALTNGFLFLVDPGPPPYQESWHYTATNSAEGLRIDGIVGTAQAGCADAPTRFSQSNVVAVLVGAPKLTLQSFSNDRASLLLQGHPGWTNVLEASTDLIVWTPLSTNVMDYSLCPVCPFVIFEDSASTNFSHRYYRAFELQ